jgi:RHS repeat-associated protein
MAGSAALAQKSGYCYIYIANESDDLVYFDNFTLSHEKSALLEETHYYPFGLTMAGISSKAAGKIENRYKFNEGTELNTDLDVSLYETEWRLYDPQIGRFHQIDKFGEFNSIVSGYVFASNNPISINDPDGLTDNVKSDTLRVVGTTKSGEDAYSNGNELDNVVITQNTRDRANSGNISFYDNASLLRYRYNNGLPLVQENDRESYIQGLENGSIVRQVERQQSAEQFESQFYGIMLTAVTLPADAIMVTGFVAKGGQFTKVFFAVNRSYGMRLAVKVAIKSVRTGSFTQSNLKLGAAMHKVYESNLLTRGLANKVEYTIKGFGRADGINLSKRVIYELKPNNVESILQGLQQLDRYRAGMYYNTERVFKTVLDLY